MEKVKMDLSNHQYAEASRNKTAIIGVTIMNVVLSVAYLLEVVKGARGIGSYIIVAASCILPSVLAIIVYLRRQDARVIRYIVSIGFAIFYTYVLFTASSQLTFCYVLVVYSILIVYEDLKINLALGAYAFFVNLVVVIKNAMTTGLSAQQMTDAEIILACIVMTCFFAVLAIRKVTKIGQSNVVKADYEKEQSEKLLQTTLAVASTITENIEVAVGETESLYSAIDTTQESMEKLTEGAHDATEAIANQQQSTHQINEYIQEVETATNQIVQELDNAEDNLKSGQEVMNELLAQVQVSQSSGAVTAKEMEELKENADQMQSIVGMISNVAHKTALLSLNASIEAARAGEAGRGFAVVAGEISNLAAQTNTATADINRLIESITQSIAEVTQAMDTLLDSNRFQNEYVGRTAENFEQIQSSTQMISRQAEQLQHTVRAVATANTQVITDIDNVSAITEEITASANETLESCNRNQQSIAKMAEIMEVLGAEAKKLQQDE